MSLLRRSVFSWILILVLTPFGHATQAIEAAQEKKAVTAVSAVTASKINHGAFSPFEAAMDALANQYGADSAIALLQLSKIERSIASLDDLAVFRAYQCYLNNFLKNNTGIDESIFFLQKSVNENPLNYSMLAAIELCQSYREPDTKEKELHLISAFQHVSSAQAATLRYWISTDFVMLATSQGRARDAIDAAQIALAVAEENRDAFRIAKSLRALAFIEIDIGNHKEALEHMSSALDIIQRMATREEELNFLVNKGYILTSMKKFADAKIVFR
jgi:tetratricopeptide (TPR) repeat protein